MPSGALSVYILVRFDFDHTFDPEEAVELAMISLHRGVYDDASLDHVEQ